MSLFANIVTTGPAAAPAVAATVAAPAAPAAKPSLFNPASPGVLKATITIPNADGTPPAAAGAPGVAIDPNAPLVHRFMPAVPGVAAPGQPVPGAAAGDEWTPDSYIEKLYKDPELQKLAVTDPKNYASYQAVRPLMAKHMKDNVELTKKVAELEKKGGGIDEKTTQELATLRARAELLDNDAFVETHTTAINGFKGAAQSLGVSESLVTRAMAAGDLKGLLAVAKEITDPDIRAEFIAQAKPALKATADFHAAMKAPVERLESARAALAQKGAARGAQTTEQILAIHGQVAAALVADPATAVFWAHPAGQKIIAEMGDAYKNGTPVTPADTVKLQLLGRASVIKDEMITNMAREIERLTANSNRLAGHQPGAAPAAAGGAPAAGGGSSLFPLPAAGGQQGGGLFKALPQVNGQR